MGIKEKYQVKSTDKYKGKEWFLKKHYANRIPNSMYCFGLYENKFLIGICNFGIPANSSYGSEFVELNRLVVNDGLEKNVLSFFVSSSLKLLPKPIKIVSYADSGMNHNGYIYQATNWIYTGMSSSDTNWTKNGRTYHRKSLGDKYGQSGQEFLLSKGYGMKKEFPKHRYFYVIGNNKKETEKLKTEIIKRFGHEEYPKGQNKRYDSSYNPTIQTELF
jgi:hypothetical protein